MFRLLILLALLVPPLAAFARPEQVIVVRHAERAAEPKADPAITPAGVERAALLARMLGPAGVQTIITTNFLRTQQTAAPLARQLGLTPVVVPMQRGELQAHIDEVIDRVESASGVVLVVGHTNTVSSLVEAFSSTRPTRLCETSFSHLFITTPAAPTLPALHLRYGAADPVPGADCQ